eukprot:6495285-Prymnesium_polylepis.1
MRAPHLRVDVRRRQQRNAAAEDVEALATSRNVPDLLDRALGVDITPLPPHVRAGQVGGDHVHDE